MFSITLSPEVESLKKDFVQWLKSNPPPELLGRIELEEFVEVSTNWQRTLAESNWIALHWPEAYGGRGLTLLHEAIIQECLAAVRAPQLINLFGLTMVGPVILAHGTPAQQQKFLRKILTAEEIWCQGFSEPDAGSDLASLRTSAIQGDGYWELHGQKVWTSFAQYAAWCFVLARTDPNQPKHKGLSYLLLPMSAEGITVRPLKQISGDEEFNELFFQGARTDLENIVGSPGDGWKIAISTLMYERVILTFARHLQSEQMLSEIRDILIEDGYDAEKAKTFGRLLARNSALRALALSHLQRYEHERPGPEGSLDKLAWSETFQEICKYALELKGTRGLFTEGKYAYRDGLLQHQYLYSRGRTIAAGTSEIQRNIIAERVLGLGKLS